MNSDEIVRVALVAATDVEKSLPDDVTGWTLTGAAIAAVVYFWRKDQTRATKTEESAESLAEKLDTERAAHGETKIAAAVSAARVTDLERQLAAVESENHSLRSRLAEKPNNTVIRKDTHD
jgi:hypothetical protein